MAAQPHLVVHNKKTPVKKATRIQWGDDELEKIAHRWIGICKRDNKDPLKHQYPTRTFMEAQLVLPPHRHRDQTSLTGINNQKGVIAHVKRLLNEESLKNAQELLAKQEADKVEKENKERVEKEAKEQAYKSPTVALQNKAISEPVSAIASSIKVPPPPQTPSTDPAGDALNLINTLTAEVSLDAELKKFADTVGKIFVSQTIASIKSAFAQEFPKLTMRALAVSKVLPKILVIGPISRQQPELEEALDGVAELKFVASDESPRLINMRGKSCIACVLWSEFCDHSHQSVMKNVFASEHIRVVSGRSLKNVREALEEIAIHLHDIK